MSKSLASRAWNATKEKDDPVFEATTPQHQQNLNQAAADVVRTGITVNKFEETVAKLNKADQEGAPETPLGTTEVRFDAADDKDAEKTAKAAEKVSDKAEKEAAQEDVDTAKANLKATQDKAKK